MLLAGDVGGTKALMALCTRDGHIVREQTYPCAQFASFDAIVDAFLADGHDNIATAAFGIAGPVIDGVAKMPNRAWTISAAELSRRLGDIRVELLNDLQSTAMGTLTLIDGQLAELQHGTAPPHAAIAVIAPGTGLGEALLVSDGVRYRALASEGGHADFAPTTDEEIDLLKFLRAKHGGHVSYERVLSGNGLGVLYDFVRAGNNETEPRWLADQMSSGDRNAAITQAALAKTDPACVHALELFVGVLGAEAGNLALRGLAIGGVMIAGGIPPKILPALAEAPTFLERFNAKGRFATWTRALPVLVSLEPRASLLGAVYSAVNAKD
jgi:glucokinase